MKSRYLLLIVSAVLAVGFFLFWNGPHSARGSNSNIVVICPSCSYDGLPQEGHLVLMDSESGEVWIYNDRAFEGKEQPIHWGKLTLGQPVVRAPLQTH